METPIVTLPPAINEESEVVIWVVVGTGIAEIAEGLISPRRRLELEVTLVPCVVWVWVLFTVDVVDITFVGTPRSLLIILKLALRLMFAPELQHEIPCPPSSQHQFSSELSVAAPHLHINPIVAADPIGLTPKRRKTGHVLACINIYTCM
jgi:hypothetical protein